MYVASVISTFMAVKFRHLAVNNTVTAFLTPPLYMICVVGYRKLFCWDILHCLWVFIAHCFIRLLTLDGEATTWSRNFGQRTPSHGAQYSKWTSHLHPFKSLIIVL